MSTASVARLQIQPNGDVMIKLDSSATDEEEALAVAIADEFCAVASGLGGHDFADFMR
jgi:hypothetical protein